MHISGLHLYAFLSPNLNFYACRSKMLNVTLIHRTIGAMTEKALLPRDVRTYGMDRTDESDDLVDRE